MKADRIKISVNNIVVAEYVSDNTSGFTLA